jgi:hypothetical protein
MSSRCLIAFRVWLHVFCRWDLLAVLSALLWHCRGYLCSRPMKGRVGECRWLVLVSRLKVGFVWGQLFKNHRFFDLIFITIGLSIIIGQDLIFVRFDVSGFN